MSAVKLIRKNAPESKTSPAEKAVDLFVISILLIFPLFVTDAYYNILPTKYYFYIGAVVVFMLALAAAAVAEKEKVRLYISGFKAAEFFEKFTLVDWSVLAFAGIALLSTVTSDYLYEAVWGNEGRFSGMFLLGLYTIAYFGVTRFGKLKRWYLDMFLLSGILVCLFGISHYFGMDLFNFKEMMKETQIKLFVSTIGNINTYTAMVGMIMAVSGMLFAAEQEEGKRRIYYFITLVISFFALVMGISDNAFLSLAAFLAFLPLYLFGKKGGVRLYLFIVATFMTVLQCISWITVVMGDKVWTIDSIFGFFIRMKDFFWIVAGMWLVLFLWYFLERRKKHPIDISGKTIKYVWLAFILIAAGSIVFMFWDVNVNGNAARYGALGTYLVFNDAWGTNRGYIWRNALECYKEFSPWKKLFGFGPDTFGIAILEKTKGNIYKQIFDNAHNEYLHYLITIGAAGLLAYVTYLISFVVRCIKKQSDNPVVMAVMMAVICYAFQAVVNLNLPIATPVMWLLLMLGVLGCSEKGTNRCE